MNRKTHKKTPENRLLEHLRLLKESELTQEVIMPLLRNMGFTHIQYVCGSGERGKDLIYMGKDCYGLSELHVCQVKNQKFSDRAHDSSNTRGVLRQIQDCRDVSVLNPETQLIQIPDRVVLISTWPLPDSHLRGAETLLEQLRSERCRVIGPDDLISLIMKSLPEYYQENIDPTEAIPPTMLAHLNKHHEAAAFELQQTKSLREFFVSLGMSDIAKTGQRMAAAESIYDPEKATKVEIANLIHFVGLQQSLFPDLDISSVVSLKHSDLAAMPRDFPDLQRWVDFVSGRSVEQGSSATIHQLVEAWIRPSHLVKWLRQQVKREANCEDAVPPLVSIQLIDYSRRLSEALLNLFPSLSTTTVTDELVRICELPSVAQTVTPADLLSLESDVIIEGDAGTGKTTLARMAAIQAITNGQRCLYFPCASIRDTDRDLTDSMAKYLVSLSSGISYESAIQYANQADLVILDGCDESITWRTSLSQDINSFAMKNHRPLSLSPEQHAHLSLPPQLQQKIAIDEKNYRLVPTGFLSQDDLTLLGCWNMHPCLSAAIQNFSRATTASRKRMILTSRSGMNASEKHSYAVYRLNAFTDDQMENFFSRWFSSSKSDLDNVLRFLENFPKIKQICSRPMMATLLAALQSNGYPLPHSRTDLYIKRFRLHLESWDLVRRVPRRNYISEEDKLLLLGALAFDTHAEHNRTFTLEAIDKRWRAGPGKFYPTLDVHDVVVELQFVNCVLSSVSPEIFSLGHLSFQEFLAARYIMHSQQESFLINNIRDTWWHDVAVFYGGLRRDASSFLDKIYPAISGTHQDNLVEEILSEARYTPPSKLPSEVYIG